MRGINQNNKKISDAEKSIYKLGKRLVKDTEFYKKYPDIVCNLKKGILPRCLIYEDRPGKRGCIIVGINPGNDPRIAKHERKFLVENGRNYNALLLAWEHGLGDGRPPMKEYRYYRRLRLLSEKLGFTGPIMWTELVKCESRHGMELSNQTIRDDIHRHLLKEIKQVPPGWPLVGVGNKAYEILTFYFKDRLVIGIPHPTSSRGQFDRLLKVGAGNLKKLLRHDKRTTVVFRCHNKNRDCNFV